ncbi:hypothetical protein G6M89_09335 [Natronolimnobius sp. AArcel1]|uniref:hypothetical protein n=1 Tax=Natronolimnobius sp. AArcel1 TaxID=1679093 RepID=UPI0013EBED3A|nr:hypothetical protein [Natronolimnobius sp. AArcel1]NGM69207.1 hypothetical protein [Natronolimnobius sp. AArcel1]
MPPKNRREDSHQAESNPGTLPDHGFDDDRLDDLRTILMPAKTRILQQILASPTGALSAVELAARSTTTESTIRDHLRDLQDRTPEIITDLKASESPVPNGIPRKYFAVTEYGISLLKQVNLYDQIGVLYDMYEAADLELPNSDARPVTLAEIETYEYRPTPNWL